MTRKLFVIIGCVVAGVAILVGGGLLAFYFSLVSTIAAKPNPAGSHTAKLLRFDGIDINFQLKVDGRQVYFSPDFAPEDADFRERISWDVDGKIVVLEVGDERIFGYNAIEQRELSAAELSRVRFTPFAEMGFEGELPTHALKE